jgi:hypothetical protein
MLVCKRTDSARMLAGCVRARCCLLRYFVVAPNCWVSSRAKKGSPVPFECTRAFIEAGASFTVDAVLESVSLSSCFWSSEEAETWLMARYQCLIMGADLAVAATDMELLLIDGVSPGQLRWVGADDGMTEGTWLWVDGTSLPLSSSMWLPGEPDDDLNGQDCAAVANGKLWDRGCGAFEPWICERSLIP